MLKQIFVGLALLSSVSACHRAPQDNIKSLDKELTTADNSADPAVQGALQDQIMVDPQLNSKANSHSIRPPDEAYDEPLPPADQKVNTTDAPVTLATRAQLKGFEACNLTVAYSAIWATKLPADLQIYPQGHVSEAAGSDTPSCHLRAVSFTTSAPVQAISDFYTSHGQQSGYTVTQASDKDGPVLVARRARDGAMFKINLAPTQGGGAAVDLVSNAGR